MARFKRPSHQELERRKIVGIHYETITDAGSTDFPGHWTGEDNSWDLDAFRDQLRVEFHYNDTLDASFSLVGVDASIANAFRRIMIANIPTVAIETVFVFDNTSVIQDEVLAHRLGLVPFRGSKDGFRNFLKWKKKPFDPNNPHNLNNASAPGARNHDAGAVGGGGGGNDGKEGDGHQQDQQQQDEMYDFNTVSLRLKVACTHNAAAAPGEEDPTKLYHHAHVYARDIEWLPIGQQSARFADGPVEPANPGILLAKLRPGQAIDMSMYMHKGVGSDHAKFSPVATASYRLLPTIDLVRPILGGDAEKFRRCFPEGVIGLERVTREEAAQEGSGYEGRAGELKAVVRDPMRDTVSRECLRHDEFRGKLRLGRKRDHFIFSVESTGQWDSDELFLESIKHLKQRAERLEGMVKRMVR